MSYLREQTESLLLHLLHIGQLEDLSRSELFSMVDITTVESLLESAADFSRDQLLPLAATGDLSGCRLTDTGVCLPAGSVSAYQNWCELGFPSLGLPESIGGLGLPRIVQSAVQELCDGANLAFGMLGISLRGAAMAIAKNGTNQQKSCWLPGLVSGNIASTIVISEPQAGSDVGRITTVATPESEGDFLLNGTKIWISYGDHDATAQILHLVLARIPGSEAGSRGLSLFVVPKTIEDKPNGVSVLRLEHKMGLHASPTCVLEFKDARGELIGQKGQGLQALFVMMNNMRLAVAVQGAAIANSATLQAIAYAAERPQGGHPLSPPVNIIEHADVRRMLLEMTAESELMRAMAMRIAFFLDKSDVMAATGDATAPQFLALAELMLPVAKTYNAETAFTVTNIGIQVMGGYGYTSDYPMERMARDIRVAAIFEGTSGIQAMDFVKRKLLSDRAVNFTRLLNLIDADLKTGPGPFFDCWTEVKTMLEKVVGDLLATSKEQASLVEGGAYATLQLAALALHCWNGHSLYTAATESVPAQLRLRNSLRYFADSVTARAALWSRRCTIQIPAFSYAK